VKGKRKVRAGEVVQDAMEKTVVVSVTSEFTHPLYGKRLRKRKKVKVHDEKNACKVGDLVQIVETRPLSKEKCWRVAKILEKTEK